MMTSEPDNFRVKEDEPRTSGSDIYLVYYFAFLAAGVVLAWAVKWLLG